VAIGIVELGIAANEQITHAETFLTFAQANL
jgi:hypothetical protein